MRTVSGKYAKQQHVKSDRYRAVEKDVLQALMRDGEAYTPDQAKKLINQFSNRKVN